MHFSLWIASLWPGFSRAWVLARWEGLILAVAFAAAINTGLVATFAWRWEMTTALSGAVATTAWVLVLSLWTVGIAWLRRDLPHLRARADGEVDPQHEELFHEAQHLYLKGHWLEAEAIVTRLIARQPLDAEARLLLASVLRRTGQYRAARKTLVELREHAVAGKWLLEIDVELRQIEELESDEQSRVISGQNRAQAA
jgi:hypothetical protein